MMLRLIIIFAVGVFLYRLFGGKLPTLRKTEEEKKIEEDTLIECKECSTYVTIKESIIANGNYYCSKACSKSKK